MGYELWVMGHEEGFDFLERPALGFFDIEEHINKCDST
jgi:hypothetical protein